MGMCLSGLPISPQASLPADLVSAVIPWRAGVDPRSPLFRIERPPKFLDRTA
jgi:hypothetical protein